MCAWARRSQVSSDEWEITFDIVWDATDGRNQFYHKLDCVLPIVSSINDVWWVRRAWDKYRADILNWENGKY